MGSGGQGGDRPDFELSSIRVPGLTDFQIAVRTFEILDVEADDDMLRRMVRLYEEGLPAALPLKQGHVMPNVREILEHLADPRRRTFVPADREHARRGEGQADALRPVQVLSRRRASRRTRRARHDRRCARSIWPAAPVRLPTTRVFVIGDTPHDIHCANAIGARTIAVATGGYTIDELADTRAMADFRRASAAGAVSRPYRRRGARRTGAQPGHRMRRHQADPGAVACQPAGSTVVPRTVRRLPGLAPGHRRRRRDVGIRTRCGAGGPRVLMATAIGSYAHAMSLESALAPPSHSAARRSMRSSATAAMTACAECEASLYPDVAKFVRNGPSRDLCRDCQWPAERVYSQLGLRVHRYSDWLTADDRAHAATLASSIPFEQIQEFTLDGVAIGEHAYAGALRFFATGSLDEEPHAESMLRRYLESALLTAYATRRLLRALNFTSVVFTHGIYVPWGIVGEVSRQEGVHVSTWNVAYRKRRFIFSHDDTYHHTLMTEPRELLGESRALAGARARADALPVEPSRGSVRLDRVPPAEAARPAGARHRDSASIPQSRSSDFRRA